MTDHDQRMKVLLQEFFPELIRLRFPEWEKFFDFTAVEWLNKEVYLNPPQGVKGVIDLLAKLPARFPDASGNPADRVVLVHTEIEGRDSVAELRKRMHDYYTVLDRHGLDVFPLAVYMRVGLEGIGWDTYTRQGWGREVLHFSYPYLGLPALDAEAFVRQENWLAVALTALMSAERGRRVELGREAWRRLVQCPESDVRRYLLCECLDAYLPLDEEQRRDFESAVTNDPDPKVRTMATTLFEKVRQEGELKGREEGRVEAQRETLVMLLQQKFGPLSAQVLEQVGRVSSDHLTHLLLGVATAGSLTDLGLGS